MADRYDALVTLITEAIATDDDDQSQRLADEYLSADDAGKDLLDRVFVCLCGWELKTLMRNCEARNQTSHD